MRSLAALLISVSLPLAAAAQGIAPDFLEVASGLVRPVVVAHAGDGSGRLFIAQQTGLYVTEYAGDGSATSKVHRIFLSPGSGGPDLDITPSTHAFGLVPTGESASVELVLENTNAGPEAVRVELMALTGSSEFALDPNGGSAPCATTPCLAPGTSCTVSVDLLASSEGSLAAELDVSGNFAPETAAFTAEICGSDDLVLNQRAVTTSEVFRACQGLVAGPDFTVESTGEAIFRAGESVVLRDGFVVETGGALRVEIF